jgi:hypothetical protein
MYLVELRPGKEELYRSGDELAAAIRSGDVDGHSRIYHRATSKWISITLHPQYKAIVAERPVQPQPAADRSSWTYLNAQSETLEGAAPDEGAGELPSRDRLHPWRRSMALSITGLLLVLGIQVSFSGPRPPWSAKPVAVSVVPASAQASAPAPTSHVVSLASTTWETPAPAEQPADSAPATVPAAPLLPKAPKLRAKSLAALTSSAAKPADAGSVEGLIAGYTAAYDSARGRLEAGMRVTRLDRLFAPARLMPNGGLTETRLALAGAANFIRVYRQQETAIERQYQDSFTVMARDQKWSTKVARRWYSRPALKEPAALAAMSATFVATVDSVFDVLDDQAGAYYFTEAGIRFEDVGATRRYGELRRHLTSLLQQARNAGGAEPGTPMAHLLQAMGSTQPPQEL